DPERLGIRDRDHVRLLDRVEAGDRRAVEAHPVVERALELAPRDREALQVPLEVGEPEEHVLDAARLDLREHLLARLRVGCRPVPALHETHSPSLKAKSPGRHPVWRPRLRRLAMSRQVYRSSGRNGRYSRKRSRMARTAVALIAVSAAVAFASAPHAAPGPYVAPARSGVLFLFSGHGWGHGVGMGQWGAQGYAQQGYTYEQILA